MGTRILILTFLIFDCKRTDLDGMAFSAVLRLPKLGEITAITVPRTLILAGPILPWVYFHCSVV